MKKLIIASAALTMAMPASATVLTFDVNGGVTDFMAVPVTYGSNVAGSPDFFNHEYDFGPEGITPNIAVLYGSPGELSRLWTTGYGDLTNVYFNDLDGDATLTLTLAAEAGFTVDLYGFDLAAFGGGENVPGLTVTDGMNNTLFSEGPFSAIGAANDHNVFDFGPNGLSSSLLTLTVDLTGLGGASDNIGLDNIRFGQTAQAIGAVPEPATWAFMIFGFGAIGGAMRRRRKMNVKVSYA